MTICCGKFPGFSSARRLGGHPPIHHVGAGHALTDRAKSKNHTNHTMSRKAHRNGIKKPRTHRYPSSRGVRMTGGGGVASCVEALPSPRSRLTARWTPSSCATSATPSTARRRRCVRRVRPPRSRPKRLRRRAAYHSSVKVAGMRPLRALSTTWRLAFRCGRSWPATGSGGTRSATASTHWPCSLGAARSCACCGGHVSCGRVCAMHACRRRCMAIAHARFAGRLEQLERVVRGACPPGRRSERRALGGRQRRGCVPSVCAPVHSLLPQAPLPAVRPDRM